MTQFLEHQPLSWFHKYGYKDLHGKTMNLYGQNIILFSQIILVHMQLMVIYGLTVDDGRSMFGRFCRYKSCQFLGDISLSIYLLHQIVRHLVIEVLLFNRGLVIRGWSVSKIIMDEV